MTTQQKSKTSTDSSNTPILLGLLSLVFVIVPYLGLALAAAGTTIGIKGMRKIEHTKDGNRFISYVPMASIPTIVKIGTVVSIIGVIVGSVVTAFATVMVIVYITSIDKTNLF